MLHARRVAPPSPASAAADELVLDWDRRRRHRFRARLRSGEEISVILPRGTRLSEGDELATEEGRRVRVRAALEPLSVVASEHPLELARLAYHLGNRHVALCIEPGRLLYQHDHVLDDLARRLGGTVTFTNAPFTPEEGAYGHSHSHAQGHSHDHSHNHNHNHDHDHDHASAHGSDGHEHP